MLTRDEVIKTIRKNLKERSGKQWSVTGGRGTAWGWITIDVPPARRIFDFNGTCLLPEDQRKYGYSSAAERQELAELLGLVHPAHAQGILVPAYGDYRQEYIDRSAGKEPAVIGVPYWN